MVNLWLHILVVAYAITGVVGTIGYIPTIKDLWHHKKMSANPSSYVIWICYLDCLHRNHFLI